MENISSQESMDGYTVHHYETGDGKPDGGAAYGIGFTISWQRGSLLTNGRNGAFLIEVLEVCLDELKHKDSQFPCQENKEAIASLSNTISILNSRLDRRKKQGTLYDHAESELYPSEESK